MSELFQDLKFGWRMLCKSPGYAAVALLTIGIGIGANAAIFSYIDGALLRPLPFANANRMVRVSSRSPEGALDRASPQDYLDWARQSTVFECITAQQWNTSPIVIGTEPPTEVPNERVTLHFFDVFRMKPMIGRAFLPGDDQVGHDHIAVLSHSFWMAEFGGDPAIIGRTFTLGTELYTVVGVMPAGAFDRTATKLWRPLALNNEGMNREARWLNAWASLKPGITIEQARAEMGAIAKHLADDFPASNKGWSVAIDPFASILVSGDVRRSLYVLMGAVAMVLVIACANLANLTLARAKAREREVAIRSALGAGRGRLIRQFLTESVMLSLGGSALGLLVAYGGMAGLRHVVPGKYLPPNTYVEMDGRILLFILILAVLTGIVFGLYPALKASRPDLTSAIKQGGPGASAGRSSQGFRAVLVVTEVALAFLLLNGAGLLIHSFFKMQHVDTGFDATNVITARLPIDPKRYPTAPEFTAFLRRIEERVSVLPGVRAVTVSSAIPMQDHGGYNMPFRIAGQEAADKSHLPQCYFQIVTPSYLGTLGLRLKRGRFLNEHDLSGTARVAVINETMAQKYFKEGDPIGQRLLVWRLSYPPSEQGGEVPWEVVGVVADEKLMAVNVVGDQTPGLYVTIDQSPQPYQSLLVRGVADPRRLEHALIGAVHEVDANQRLQYLTTLEDIKADAIGDERLHSLLLTIFGGIAICLSAMGLYGVISYSVGQRTREIGIRTALGATSRDIVWLVLRGGLLLTGVGLLVGYACSLGAMQLLASLLFNVGKYDLTALVSVVALLVTMVLLASYVPARRALKVNPVTALRQD